MRKIRDVNERFWEKVDLDAANGCWEWEAGRFPNGYGSFGLTPGGPHKRALAHRWAYEALGGPIPEGLDLDHLCRNRACVNPAHIEPVSRSENLRRSPLMGRSMSDRPECKNGHPFTPENTHTGSGFRRCRACGRENMRRLRKQAA